MCLEMKWIIQLSSSKYSHLRLGTLTPRLLQHILYGAALERHPETKTDSEYSSKKQNITYAYIQDGIKIPALGRILD